MAVFRHGYWPRQIPTTRPADCQYNLSVTMGLITQNQRCRQYTCERSTARRDGNRKGPLTEAALLFGGFHRRLSLADLIAAGTDEYMQDRLLGSNEG
jgi:hypothetical protein